MCCNTSLQYKLKQPHYIYRFPQNEIYISIGWGGSAMTAIALGCMAQKRSKDVNAHEPNPLFHSAPKTLPNHHCHWTMPKSGSGPVQPLFAWTEPQELVRFSTCGWTGPERLVRVRLQLLRLLAPIKLLRHLAELFHILFPHSCASPNWYISFHRKVPKFICPTTANGNVLKFSLECDNWEYGICYITKSIQKKNVQI